MTTRRSDRAAGLVRGFPPVPTDAHPVVLVHPGAVRVADYAALADVLRPAAALVVVDLEQVPEYFDAALTGGTTTTSIDALAERLTGVLRDRGLPERWTLAGWSFGGVVAHAAAARLAPAERPARLVLLDSIAPVPEYTAADGELSADLVLDWFAMYLAAKRGAPVDAPPAGVGLDAGLDHVLASALRSGALRAGTTAPGLRKVFTTYADGLRRNNVLARSHTPAPVDVPVVLIRPDRGLLTTPDPLGWESLAPALTTANCPGDHYSMLRHPEALAVLADLTSPLTR